MPSFSSFVVIASFVQAIIFHFSNGALVQQESRDTPLGTRGRRRYHCSSLTRVVLEFTESLVSMNRMNSCKLWYVHYRCFNGFL